MTPRDCPAVWSLYARLMRANTRAAPDCLCGHRTPAVECPASGPRAPTGNSSDAKGQPMRLAALVILASALSAASSPADAADWKENHKRWEAARKERARVEKEREDA